MNFLGWIENPNMHSIYIGERLQSSIFSGFNLIIGNVCKPITYDTMECTTNVNPFCSNELKTLKIGNWITSCNGSYNGYVPLFPSSKALEKVYPHTFPIQKGNEKKLYNSHYKISNLVILSKLSYHLSFSPL